MIFVFDHADRFTLPLDSFRKSNDCFDISCRDIHMVETDEVAKNDETESKLWDLSMKMTGIRQYL